MKIRNRTIIHLVAQGIVLVLRVLFLTVRARFACAPGTRPAEQLEPRGERFLYPMWHDTALLPLFLDKNGPMAALTSLHSDGDYVESVLGAFKIVSVRGSSKRGGAAAVRRLMDEVADKHVTITPDGPRGPRREMKAGIVYLASQSGRRIVPTAFTADRFWSVKGSWTDLLIPKPFATAYLMSGEPISVPSDLSRVELDEQVRRIQESMDRLEEDVQEWMRTGIVPERPAEIRRAA